MYQIFQGLRGDPLSQRALAATSRSNNGFANMHGKVADISYHYPPSDYPPEADKLRLGRVPWTRNMTKLVAVPLNPCTDEGVFFNLPPSVADLMRGLTCLEVELYRYAEEISSIAAICKELRQLCIKCGNHDLEENYACDCRPLDTLTHLHTVTIFKPSPNHDLWGLHGPSGISRLKAVHVNWRISSMSKRFPMIELLTMHVSTPMGVETALKDLSNMHHVMCATLVVSHPSMIPSPLPAHLSPFVRFLHQ